MHQLVPIAEQVAAGVLFAVNNGKPVPTWDELRGVCDVCAEGVLPASGLDWLTDETATHINTMRDEFLIETQATIARRREAEAMLRRAGFTTEGSQR